MVASWRSSRRRCNSLRAVAIFSVAKESTTKMITLIQPILSEYSEKNSISLIIDKKNIIVGKTLLDITDDILKIVDEKIGKIQLD